MKIQCTLFGAVVATGLLLTVNAFAGDEPAQSEDQVKATLVDLETQSWVAWKARDGKYFQSFTTDDCLDMQPSGPIGKADVVAGVSSPMCVVSSYSLRLMRFA